MFSSNYPYTPYQTQQTNNGIIWCQGLSGAKSYPVGPGQTVLLMDSEANVFYIKSADVSGMPMPLRIFDWKERIEKSDTAPNFVTREEFEKAIKELRDGKQSVSATE